MWPGYISIYRPAFGSHPGKNRTLWRKSFLSARTLGVKYYRYCLNTTKFIKKKSSYIPSTIQIWNLARNRSAE